MNYDDCSECKKRMWPENPEASFFIDVGDRLPALCTYCVNSINGKSRPSVKQLVNDLSARVTFLEEVDQPIDRHLRSDVQQLKMSNLYLQKQVKELQIKKKSTIL